MRRVLTGAVAAALLLTPAAAQAKPVTEKVATVEARDLLDFQTGVENPELYAGVMLVSYELDPCVPGRRQASCDFTATYSDGDVCDGEILVRATRRGKLLTEMTLDYCDSDEVED